MSNHLAAFEFRREVEACRYRLMTDFEAGVSITRSTKSHTEFYFDGHKSVNFWPHDEFMKLQ